MSTGAFRPRWRPNTANGGVGTCRLPNHWVLPTAASFGWIVEAAAANPLRSTAAAQNDFEGYGKQLSLRIVGTEALPEAPVSK